MSKPCCPDKVNTDPRRHNPYIPPSPSRSEPLSHAEYLRLKKANNNCALSGSSLQTTAGKATATKYEKTIWTETKVSLPIQIQTQPVPKVHPGGHAIEAGLLTMMNGSVEARGTISKFDTTNRNEFNTTYRRQGLAIVQDDSFKAPAGGTREICEEGCAIEGTKDVVPGNPGCC